MHGTSPVQEAVTLSFKDHQLRLKSLEEDILKNYDHKPMVVIHDLENIQEIQTILRKSKLRYEAGCSSEVLEQVKQWEYGILLLTEVREEECIACLEKMRWYSFSLRSTLTMSYNRWLAEVQDPVAFAKECYT